MLIVGNHHLFAVRETMNTLYTGHCTGAEVKKSTGCRIARGKGVPYRIGDRILKPKTGTLADPEIDKMNKVSDSHEGPGVKSLAEEVIAVLYGRFRQGSLRA